MNTKKVDRLDVWLVSLNPTKGREINRTRPCIVVSPDELSALSTVIVAPMTTKGFEVPLPSFGKISGKERLILID